MTASAHHLRPSRRFEGNREQPGNDPDVEPLKTNTKSMWFFKLIGTE
jgi:hypothetical protein